MAKNKKNDANPSNTPGPEVADEVKAKEVETTQDQDPGNGAEDKKAEEVTGTAEVEAPKPDESKDIEKDAEDKKAKKDKKTLAAVKVAQAQLFIMDRHKTDTIFRNPKGEYFTNQNLAMLSVKSKKERLDMITRKEVTQTLQKAK